MRHIRDERGGLVINPFECKYSEHDLSMNDLVSSQIAQCNYVECPKCGSIRSIKSKWIDGRYHYLYPVHDTLMGTARVRDQWWKLNKDSKRWAIVQKSEVK